jgi:hypothetical protein
LCCDICKDVQISIHLYCGVYSESQIRISIFNLLFDRIICIRYPRAFRYISLRGKDVGVSTQAKSECFERFKEFKALAEKEVESHNKVL